MKRYLPKKIQFQSIKKLISNCTQLDTETDLIWIQKAKVCFIDCLWYLRGEHGYWESVKRGFLLAVECESASGFSPKDPYLEKNVHYLLNQLEQRERTLLKEEKRA